MFLDSKTTNECTVNDPLLTQEKLPAYETEKGAWVSTKVFAQISISEMSAKVKAVG